MGAQGQKGQLPRYRDADVVLLRGCDLNKIHTLLESWRPLAGKGVKITAGPGGSVIEAEGGGGGEQVAPLCSLGGFGKDGKMTPGFFVGGGKTVWLEPGKITPSPNKKVWVSVGWKCEKEDGVLMPGGKARSVRVSSGMSVPDDDIPNVNSLSGRGNIPLGGWDSDSNWVPTGCGDVTLSFCPGGFLKSRLNV